MTSPRNLVFGIVVLSLITACAGVNNSPALEERSYFTLHGISPLAEGSTVIVSQADYSLHCPVINGSAVCDTPDKTSARAAVCGGSAGCRSAILRDTVLTGRMAKCGGSAGCYAAISQTPGIVLPSIFIGSPIILLIENIMHICNPDLDELQSVLACKPTDSD